MEKTRKIDNPGTYGLDVSEIVEINVWPKDIVEKIVRNGE